MNYELMRMRMKMMMRMTAVLSADYARRKMQAAEYNTCRQNIDGASPASISSVSSDSDPRRCSAGRPSCW